LRLRCTVASISGQSSGKICSSIDADGADTQHVALDNSLIQYRMGATIPIELFIERTGYNEIIEALQYCIDYT
jgi:hypothetical protein